MSRNIFIDCGGHMGESIKLFLKSPLYKSDFLLYTFEPIINIDKYLVKKRNKGINIITFRDAVWINDGVVDFYVRNGRNDKYNVGSTLIKEKITGRLNKNKPISTKCIDFSRWLLNNFNSDDFIILKMDIEGAEYAVLNKMIEDKSINLIKKLFIEFHWDKIRMTEKDHKLMIEKLTNIKSLELLPEMKYVFLK